jgi:hypothetical protein
MNITSTSEPAIDTEDAILLGAERPCKPCAELIDL